MVGATSGQDLLSELARRFSLVESGTDCSQEADHREQPRYELRSATVRVSIDSRYGLSAGGLLADVSTVGARIITDFVPCVGEIVRLAFEMGEGRVVLDGEVRHVGVEDSVRYFGVRFAG
jgi:hypothetical protein